MDDAKSLPFHVKLDLINGLKVLEGKGDDEFYFMKSLDLPTDCHKNYKEIRHDAKLHIPQIDQSKIQLDEMHFVRAVCHDDLENPSYFMDIQPSFAFGCPSLAMPAAEHTNTRPEIAQGREFARGRVSGRKPVSKSTAFETQELVNQSLIALQPANAEASSFLLTLPPGFDESLFLDDTNEATENVGISSIADELLNFTNLEVSATTTSSREERHETQVVRRDKIIALTQSLQQDLIQGFQNKELLSSTETDKTIQGDETVEVSNVQLPDLESQVDIDELESDLNNLLGQALSTSKRPQERLEESWAVETPVDTRHFDQLVPNMAIKYPFELDTFQKEAILHLEAGESVFVAAHTSAGKTVVAEYAVALAMAHRTRVVYTSPIKALSNQKYRDFCEKFSTDDVGLLTGDVSLNPTGSCLVMTTEILRSMLYRGADIVRDIEWVIFDEVHYINDAERGVVWEEVIIMLPKHVGLIFLSATTPNTYEFSSWIGRTKQRKVHVISTERRPVPLEHFLYAGKDLCPILDAKKNFLKPGYDQAMKLIKSDADAHKGKAFNPASRRQQNLQQQAWKSSKPGGNENAERTQWYSLVKELENRALIPIVVFSFSKAVCDNRAAALQAMNMTTALEKSQIHVIFSKSIKRLQPGDRLLPQILRLEELVLRGIAVHHGGLLPILKEIVEILFAKGLIKVLFATETFAIGVNMPAKTVVFNGLRKHDGTRFRDLLPGEYTQMAGRAGRRGLDTVGTVIIFLGVDREPPPLDVLSTMLTGTATKLSSQFRLTYTMILILLRTAEMSVADMIKRSFSEFGTQRYFGGLDVNGMISQASKRLSKLQLTLDSSCEDVSSQSLEEYERNIHLLQTHFALLTEQLLNGEFLKKSLSSLFCPGRILGLMVDQIGMFWGVLQTTPKSVSSQIRVVELSEKATERTLPLSSIMFVSSAILAGNAASSSIETAELESLLDPVKLKITDLDFVSHWRDCSHVARGVFANEVHQSPRRNEYLLQQYRVSSMARKLDATRSAISDENLALYPDFVARLEVLTTLGYITRLERTAQLKGRAASEINTCDELILTELIFDDVFGPLLPEECVALCSALVLQQRKCEDQPTLTPNLEIAKDKMMDIARRLEMLQKRYRVEIDAEYIETAINIGLMEVVYEWARGMPFRSICMLTSLEEGSIVRCITRLDETCREVRNIAHIIGNAELYKKMERASELIKRDIIFASSLYISS